MERLKLSVKQRLELREQEQNKFWLENEGRLFHSDGEHLLNWGTEDIGSIIPPEGMRQIYTPGTICQIDRNFIYPKIIYQPNRTSA